jgi:hypothetical protein
MELYTAKVSIFWITCCTSDFSSYINSRFCLT